MDIDRFRYKQLWVSRGQARPVSQWICLNDRDGSDGHLADQSDADCSISIGAHCEPDSASDCLHPLYFQVTAREPKDLPQAALPVWYYLPEQFSIPEELVDACFDGDRTITLQVPFCVFASEPTSLMPAFNYRLARKMVQDGVERLCIDLYLKDQCTRVPNSLNHATDRFAIPLGLKESLYLGANAILELAKNPRPEDSFVSPRHVPEAAEWFTEVLEADKKRHDRQQRLREAILRDGWQIPPCIRRLQWADLPSDEGLEACRILGRWFPFIHAGQPEVWQLILRSAQRNDITDRPHLRAIVAFGRENPGFVGCEHPLLGRFCPPGGCFMTEMLNECTNPLLFR